MADHVRRVGQLDEALRIRREDTLPIYERLGDIHSAAITRLQIATELYRRGERPAAIALVRELAQAPHLGAESSAIAELLDEWTANSGE